MTQNGEDFSRFFNDGAEFVGDNDAAQWWWD